MLEPTEEALDLIALAVDALRHGALDDPVAWGRDACLGPGGSDEIEEGMGVIGPVGDHMTAFEIGDESWRGGEVMSLAGGQDDPHRQAVLVDQGVDLGAQSAARTADGVILAPFFPPAACWWARIIELSIRAIECGDLAASASNTPTQTPSRAQRLKRL